MSQLPSRSLRSLRQLPKQIRNASTATTSSPTTPTPTPTFLQRYRRALLWTTLGLAIGGTTGSLISHTIAPPPHPLPGTHEDAILLNDLHTRIDTEFKVKVLRGKCTAVAASLRGEEATWRELDAASMSCEGRLTAEALAGARALGVQRVFWNERECEVVAVVWFGGGVAGWPGVTHGGAIATLVSEKMALAARLGRGGLPESRREEGDGHPARLDIKYLKPTYANAFYVVRAVPRYGAFETRAPGEVEVDAQLETLDGVVCVKVTGTVVVPEDEGKSQGTWKSVTPSKSWLGWQSRSDA